MVGVGLDLLGLHLFAIELQHLRAVVVDPDHGMEKRHNDTPVEAPTHGAAGLLKRRTNYGCDSPGMATAGESYSQSFAAMLA
jgi:hypothetical protein